MWEWHPIECRGVPLVGATSQECTRELKIFSEQDDPSRLTRIFFEGLIRIWPIVTSAIINDGDINILRGSGKPPLREEGAFCGKPTIWFLPEIESGESFNQSEVIYAFCMLVAPWNSREV
jgi:hypothetical protein